MGRKPPRLRNNLSMMRRESPPRLHGTGSMRRQSWLSRNRGSCVLWQNPRSNFTRCRLPNILLSDLFDLLRCYSLLSNRFRRRRRTSAHSLRVKHSVSVLFGRRTLGLRCANRWLEDFEAAGFKDSVKPLILKQNAIRLLKLDQAEKK